MHRKTQPKTGASRRDFLIGSAAVAGAAAVAAAEDLVIPARGPFYHVAEQNTLKVGLVGCGGRGSGAAANALNADGYAELVAMGDLFPDKLEASLKNLQLGPAGQRVKVPKENQFTGIDAYKGVIEKSDVVLLATPPHFRPMQLRAAIDAGKHVFCEKPVAVDVPGVNKVLEACKIAKEKKLSVLSGLCYRYDEAKQEVVKRVHDGQIGEIINLQGMYNTGPLWSKPRQPDWGDMEWQLRNWLYFTWLSGDHIVEQHIHTIDKMLWLMKDVTPIKVTCNGGRTVRTAPEFGHIYDHFDSIYEWTDGQKAFCQTRQWLNCDSDTSDFAFGTKGVANVMGHAIKGEESWRRKPAAANMYDSEHVALFTGIRKGEPINNGDYMCKSTLMAIMGRMAAYTGKTVYWSEDDAPSSVKKDPNGAILLNSKEDLTPPTYDLKAKFPCPEIAVPGKTKFA